jgi:hypothetical protein
MTRRLWRALATAGLLSAAVFTAVDPAAAIPAATANQSYEVWLADKAGDQLLVYSGDALDDVGGPRNQAQVLDLAALFDPGGAANGTGVPVSMPSSVDPSPDGRNVVVAFSGSGHVGVIDTESRRPKALFLMPADGGRGGVPSAQWSADGTAIVVANRAASKLERIDYDAPTDTFAYSARADLDLAGCTTPSGYPCQSETEMGDLGPNHRPDTSPVCAITTDRGHTVVTLQGGGMFLVDSAATPMHLVAAWGNTAMGRNACGGRQLGRYLYLNADTSSPGHPGQYSLYQLRDNFPRAPKTISDNDTTRVPKSFYRAPDGDQPHLARGMAIGGTRDVIWQFDRAGDAAELFDSNTLTHLTTVSLVGQPGVDPMPGLADVSPDGRWMFTVTGGAPQPLGLGIIELNAPGTSGDLIHVLATPDVDPVGDPTLDHPTITAKPPDKAPASTVPGAREPVTTEPAMSDTEGTTKPTPTTTKATKRSATTPTEADVTTTRPAGVIVAAARQVASFLTAPVTRATAPARGRAATTTTTIRRGTATIPSTSQTQATPVKVDPNGATAGPTDEPGATEPGSLAVVVRTAH